MDNVSRLLERYLDAAEIRLLRRASTASAPLSVGLFLVGGSVRDILSGGRPTDLDLTVVGGTADLPERLAERLGGELWSRSQFNTSKISAGGVQVDLVAARKESYPSPGALPVVAPGSIDDDLARRDFSVNAMAVSLAEESWGELLDPFDGRRDLDRGLVRVLHPRSFVDDPTRIFRAVRYAARRGFTLDAETERMMARDFGHLDAVSGDRVRHEIERIFREPLVEEILRKAQRLGVLEAVHAAFRIGPDLLSRLASAPFEPTQAGDLRRLAMTLFDVPVSQLQDLATRLNLGSEWSRVAADVGRVREAFPRLRGAGVRRSEIFAALRNLEPAAIEGCAMATDEKAVRRRLELYLAELRHISPLLNGHDLIALGVPQGPLVGKLLEEVLTARLDGLLSTRDEEETLAVQSLDRRHDLPPLEKGV